MHNISPPPDNELDAHLDMERSATLEQIFAEQGLLARSIPGYRVRASQMKMARAVAATMQHAQMLHQLYEQDPDKKLAASRPRTQNASAAKKVPNAATEQPPLSAELSACTLLAEAGTGTGKTFAYLAPALLWGGKVMVSTATRHLQDQLFYRDIPTLRQALAVPSVIALLKGRANYVCHYHLERTVESGQFASKQEVGHLQKIQRFIKTTVRGDVSELAGVPENASIWAKVTSTRENCLGQECPHYKPCFVMRARREAQQADVVVVNHALFFADVMLRDTGASELLPSVNTVIFDEAHQLPEIATNFLGETFSSHQCIEFAREVLLQGVQHAPEAIDWAEQTSALERAARALRLAFDKEVRVAMHELDAAHPLYPALQSIDTALEVLRTSLESQASRGEELEHCVQRSQELQASLRGFYASIPVASTQKASSSVSNHAAPTPDAVVRWLEVFTHTVQLHATPLSIAPLFIGQLQEGPRAWILTSATLSVRGDFSHYARQLGLDAKRSLSVPSPFAYQEQALLYVPQGLPEPAAPHFMDAVVEAALPVLQSAEASGGGVFFLCTTLRAVEQAAQQLSRLMEEGALKGPIWVQGRASRTELLERFRTHSPSILIGSQSFWEGVDMPGDALSLVIIDKLPFAPPGDPVLAARLAALAQKGEKPFFTYQIPQAVIALKQGAGRLIRSETDCGVLMICDPRLTDKPYGRRIWQSLPPFKRTRELDVVRAFLS